MKKSFLVVIALLMITSVDAQKNFLISTPELSFTNNILIIKYDITGCGTGQYIDISVKVVNSRGDTLRPVYISGDIGERVNCGFGKKIEWDIFRDSLKIDDDIEVFLHGREVVVSPPVADLQAVRVTTRGKVLGLSAIVPGLGQKKASGKSGYLAFTGIVYGAAGASAYFYLKHKDYYNQYLEKTGAAADEAFAYSEDNFNKSQYFLYGAAGAWALNMIWSAAIPIKDKPLKNTSLSIIPAPGKQLLFSATWTF